MIDTSGEQLNESIRQKLRALYGDAAEDVYMRVTTLLGDKVSTQPRVLALSERDALVIAYGDHVRRAGEAPLVTLRKTLKALDLPVSGVHILPFYPYSSDDGFSVIDYRQVDPALGTWADVRALSGDYRLMFDAVFNHISAQSAWFQGFLRGESKYAGYFIITDPTTDLSQVTRPRTLPLLSGFDAHSGRIHVWTTFSDDQIDLNFANPDVLLEMLAVLLFYVEQGAQLIRLDAIAFLWKQIGTTCIHLPETHLVIQLLRAILDAAAPETILVTETNVPHRENIAYFGDGANEAQMVYQFPLPPLILHTLASSDATALTRWAADIKRISERTTFFNFTASHDGIGVRPASGILSDAEIAALVDLTLAHGGFVSYKSNPDGTQSPYELNITYFDAITHPSITAEKPQVAIERFIVSQAIMLAFVGVPGIYLPSLIGSRNDAAGVAQTGRFRSINREKLDADTLLGELAEPASLRAQVLARYRRLLEARSAEAAFHPLGGQMVRHLHPRVFALERTSPDGAARVLALHNVSGEPVSVALDTQGRWRDLLTATRLESPGKLVLAPYQIAWLRTE